MGASSDFGRPWVSVLVRPSVLGLVVITTAIIAIGRGAVALSPMRVIEAIFGRADERDTAIVWTIRLPRVLLAMLVGAALSGSGAILQGIARNPLADPALIGISGGAAVGAILSLMLGLHAMWALPLAAFAGAQLAVIAALALSRSEGRISATTLLIGGIGLAAFASAAMGMLLYLADDSVLRSMTFWTLGSVGGATWVLVGAVAIALAIAAAIIVPITRDLDRLQLGELEARHVGVDVDRILHRATFAVSLAVGAAVATCGVIGFVGLIVPYLARSAVGPATATLLPIAALGGALLLVIADLVARTCIPPTEVPIGVLTSALGAPVLLAIVRRGAFA
ncbi:MAG: iron ABC transporter permease [Kofleriaceae bacterium]